MTKPTGPPLRLDATTAPDEDLMARVRDAGDADAFTELANRYRGPLTRYFAALLPADAPADDMAQETLLRLWLLRARYRPTGRFSAYLFQIARHYGLNQRTLYRAKTIRELSTDAAPGLELVLPPARQPERVLLERMEQARRERAVAALPEPYRAVFTLGRVEGLRHAEISARLGVPVGTVKSRMSEAVRRLRRTLNEENEEK